MRDVSGFGGFVTDSSAQTRVCLSPWKINCSLSHTHTQSTESTGGEQKEQNKSEGFRTVRLKHH